MYITIREATRGEYDAVGKLTVRTYQELPGMPDANAMPEYYAMLADTSARVVGPSVKIIVAIAPDGKILGCVTYYGKMEFYGSGGTAPLERNAVGIRLLAVDDDARGQGIGRKLTEYCISLAKQENLPQVILHTTKAMQQAWGLYESMGFKRSPDLDFIHGPLPVFGFRKQLDITSESITSP